MSSKPTLDLTPEGEPPVDMFVTFGVQYGPTKERHPVADWIDGDGYVRITAPSYETARALAFAVFGSAWAFDYPTPPDAKWAPLGELAHITVSLELTPARLHDSGIYDNLTQVQMDGVIVAETRRFDLT